MSRAKIIIIAGGSFQGKSTIALNIAAKLRFSGVVSTDSVRNVLKVLNPNKKYFSLPIYLLPEDLLQRKMEDVSDVLISIIKMYQVRGEHVVVEGVHFSPEFLKWASDQDFLNLCISNNLSFKERVLLKTTTRSNFRLLSLDDQKQKFSSINNVNIQDSSYMQHKDNIKRVNDLIVQKCIGCGFEMINYTDIEEGVNFAVEKSLQWFER